MTPTFKKRYRAWIKQASYDLAAAKISLQHEFYEWTTYQAEQTVEKALKSVIVHAGERPPKIHKLSVLFGFCNSVNPRFKKTKFDFNHVEAFAFISRYPFLLPGKDKAPHEQITKENAKESIAEAEIILNQIKGILKSDIEPIKDGEEAIEGISKEDLEKRLKVVVDSLVREFQPDKIILFGSYARDPLPKRLTTIDLLIVADTQMSFIQRIRKARALTKGAKPSIEPLIYTPAEYITMTEEEGESFIEHALDEGRVLFSKKFDNGT